MKRPLVALLTLISVALTMVVFLPAARPVQAGQADSAKGSGADNSGVRADPGSGAGSDLTKAEDYCVKKGGEVDDRVAYYNTNGDPQSWLRLGGVRQFCEFTMKNGGSRIYVELSTLYNEEPTLAALAYYAAPALTGSCNGNPASCYCSQLGGTDLFGGINAAGGGWVKKSDPIFTVLEACIFPDMSTIDSWGLAYHSFGIIRGKDLAKVLRYKNPYGVE
ncbi:MAG: hypothetical protein ACLQFM_12300 [Terriglobales bacterium]|jgi:putative hemolysin